MGEELPRFLGRASQFCGQYVLLDFLSFKKK